MTFTRLLLALLSGGAATIHLAAVGAHLNDYLPFAAFFALIAFLQAAWSVVLLIAPTRHVLIAGAIGNAIVVAIWITSRTVGVPVGPHPGMEPAGLSDTLVTIFECVIVAGTLAMAWRALAGALPALGTGLAVLVVAALSSSAGAARDGHLHSSEHAAHHLAHLLVVGGAAIIFCVYLAVHVGKNGWPSFSWRLRPTARPKSVGER